MSTAPQNITDQLMRDEGLRLYPYTDTTGHITIGVGRNLSDEGITPDEARFLLQNDITRAETRLAAALPWTEKLDSVRRAVFVNMTFNMGITGLLGFRTALSDAQVGNWQGAHDAMLDSKWARQVGQRAQRLAQQLLTGEWQ